MATSQTKFTGNRYEVIAWANDQDVLFYREFGSYQGDFLLIAKDRKTNIYYVYKGSYGSCSGCDDYENKSPSTKEEAIKFAKDYQPYLTLNLDEIITIVSQKEVLSILPRNTRADHYEEASSPSFLELIAKILTETVIVEEKLPITTQDILECGNQEYRRRMLDIYGHENFFNNVPHTIIETENDGELVRFDNDFVCVYVQDSSTDRKYLIRVDPNCKTVHEAKAWTFGLKSEQYNPVMET